MRYLVAILLASVLAGCAGLEEKLPPAPTIAEIIQMAKSGQSADAIIQRLQESRAFYQLPASELIPGHPESTFSVVQARVGSGGPGGWMVRVFRVVHSE